MYTFIQKIKYFFVYFYRAQLYSFKKIKKKEFSVKLNDLCFKIFYLNLKHYFLLKMRKNHISLTK